MQQPRSSRKVLSPLSRLRLKLTPPSSCHPPHPRARLPTFLYAMPFSPTKIFLEETSLVARPIIPFPELKLRLEKRMQHLGIKVGGRLLRAGSARRGGCTTGGAGLRRRVQHAGCTGGGGPLCLGTPPRASLHPHLPACAACLRVPPHPPATPLPPPPPPPHHHQHTHKHTPILNHTITTPLHTTPAQVLSVEEEEFCAIPMGGCLPARPQRVIGVGGTAGMVHPSTGYMVRPAAATAGMPMPRRRRPPTPTAPTAPKPPAPRPSPPTTVLFNFNCKARRCLVSLACGSSSLRFTLSNSTQNP